MSCERDWLNGLNGLLVVSAVLVLLYSQKNCSGSKYYRARGDEEDSIQYTVLMMGILLWPVIWDCTMGYSSLKIHPFLWLALLWPMVLCYLQMVDYKHDKHEKVQNPHEQRTSSILNLHGDSGTVISISFAMGTIFLAVSRLSNQTIVYQSIKVVMVALLICIALVIPATHYMDNNQPYTAYIRQSQRVFINYATGFIMAALLMMFSAKISTPSSSSLHQRSSIPL